MRENNDDRQTPRWVTLDELVHNFVSLKKSRIYYLVHMGHIPHMKVGRTLVFDMEKIESWLKSFEVKNDG